MELFEYARPQLMAGKTILYVHGFASSGSNGTVRALRLLLPQAEVTAPDLPVEPEAALELLRSIVASSAPDLVIGSSMGGMYAECLRGIDRILVNPAFQLADTLLKNNGLGRQTFHSPRADGQKDFLVTKTLLEGFRTVSARCFSDVDDEEKKRVFALFGVHDTLVDTRSLTRQHYPQCIPFEGAHYLNDDALLHSVLPVIQWIDDRQNRIVRPSVIICYDDVLRLLHNGEMVGAASKAVRFLSARFDLHFLITGDADGWEDMELKRSWVETHIGVPSWNRITLTAHKELLMGDYLIDCHPEQYGGEAFMGTLIRFGSDSFKNWNDVMVFFARICGESV